MTDWRKIAEHIGETTREPFSPDPSSRIGGGSINKAVRLSDDRRSYFVKLNDAGRLSMFEAEVAGLREIEDTHTLRVPKSVCVGAVGDSAYLVMEYVESGWSRNESTARAGRGLAALHRHGQQTYGWFRENTIGSTAQSNEPAKDWIMFWRDRRLGAQLEMAARNGYGGRLQDRGQELLESLSALIDHRPQPSLLHGDLWSGNLFYDNEGEPVVYDPAVYYGDREADLAMTELFGGFGGDFYAAYNEAWPLDCGYNRRKTLYNLYHILNHLNLFGGGYLSQAEGMINRLLSELN